MTMNWQQFADSYGGQFSVEQRCINFPPHASSESSTMIAPLPYLSSISITGNDAAKLLQGQATCHMDELSSEAPSSMGALCTNKGRVYSLFRCINLVKAESPHYTLFMHHSLTALTLAKLAKYAVFYKTKLLDTDQEWVSFGLQGVQSTSILNTIGLPAPSNAGMSLQHNNITITCIQSADSTERFQLFVNSEQAANLWQQLTDAGAIASSTTTWQQQDILAGIPWLTEASTEQFLPQMLNLHTSTLGAISFSKGCYTGQEIVARTKYLGKLKRRLFIVQLSEPCELQAGTELFSASRTSAIGTVINATNMSDSRHALVVLQVDQKECNDIYPSGYEHINCALSDVPYDTTNEN